MKSPSFTATKYGTVGLATILLFILPTVGVTGKNTGVIPFLLSPLIIALFLPYLLAADNWYSGKNLTVVLSYPLLIFLLFLLSYIRFSSPRLPACVRGVLFLYSFTIALTGLAVLLYGFGCKPFTVQWLSTFVALLVLGSIVILSPIIDRYYANPGIRRLLILISTRVNPFLAMGGDILNQDLLRGTVLYKHLSIGRFYSYSAPRWEILSIGYLLMGGSAGAAGCYLFRSPIESDSKP